MLSHKIIAMDAKPDCIVCSKVGREVVRNNLPMLLCEACGLFWRRSFDLPKNYYEDMDFGVDNKDKVQLRYTNSEERARTFAKYADLNNLCDVGCGEGIFLKVLQDFGCRNVIGLEPSANVMSFALEKGITVIEGSVEALEDSFFKDRGIHTVTMFHVIEHLKDPKATITRLYDCLAKGDKLILETPDTESFMLRKSNYNHELIYPEHLYYFNKVNLSRLLEQSGFTIVASGNRDFNQKSLSIKESLTRLGLLPVHQRKGKVADNFDRASSVAIKSDNGILKQMIRRMLSEIVTILGRGTYLWFVVQK